MTIVEESKRETPRRIIRPSETIRGLIRSTDCFVAVVKKKKKERKNRRGSSARRIGLFKKKFVFDLRATRDVRNEETTDKGTTEGTLFPPPLPPFLAFAAAASVNEARAKIFLFSLAFAHTVPATLVGYTSWIRRVGNFLPPPPPRVSPEFFAIRSPRIEAW